MSASSTNLGNILNFQPEEEEEKEIEPPKPFIKKINRQISVQHDHIKKEIFKKLNEGCVLNFLRSSERKDTTKTKCSETYKEMNYDLCMINKYDENLNSSLSFISEFDLENEDNDKDNSFNSSDNDNSVEQIDIFKKHREKLNFNEDKEYDSKLENELNEIKQMILNKTKISS